MPYLCGMVALSSKNNVEKDMYYAVVQGWNKKETCNIKVTRHLWFCDSAVLNAWAECYTQANRIEVWIPLLQGNLHLF